MAWIESHQGLESHPKVLKLCALTGWSKNETIGILHRFWWWVLSYAEDGDLSKYESSQIIGHLKTDCDYPKVYQAFKDSGFIDPDEKVHDWFDFAGKYLTSKYRTSNPERLKSIVENYKTDFRLTKGGLKTAHIPTYQHNQHNQQTPLVLTDFAKSIKTTIQKCQRIKITDEILSRLCKSWEQYKEINFSVEIIKADTWLVANNRHKSNYGRYLSNWFNRCLDRGGSAKYTVTSQGTPKMTASEEAEALKRHGLNK